MARRCSLTGRGVQTGNNVSHAQNKTRRRFLPNIQSRQLYSEALNETVRLKIAARTIRTIEKRGGLDAFLLSTSDGRLPSDLVRMKGRIALRRAAQAED